MSGRAGGQRAIESGGGELRRGLLFGLFDSWGGRSTKSLDAGNPLGPRSSRSWGIEVPLEAEAFATACRTQKAALEKLILTRQADRDRDRDLATAALTNFLSRGLRYHSADREASKAAAALALVLSAERPSRALYDSGLIQATLTSCKVLTFTRLVPDTWVLSTHTQ